MNERPLLFSGPMVRAVLDGRKTQTRRVVDRRMYLVVDGDEDTGRIVEQSDDDFGALAQEHARCPYGVTGDRLWVREAFYIAGRGTWAAPKTVHPTDSNRAAYYREGWDRVEPHWRPSIHMPRWASRLTLEITQVRVERLQAITEEDARAEGIGEPPWGTRAETFATLWDALNAKRGLPWSANPWVWAITFRRVA